MSEETEQEDCCDKLVSDAFKFTDSSLFEDLIAFIKSNIDKITVSISHGK